LLREESVRNAMIFCNRKRDVRALYSSLKKHDFAAGEMHGDMSQPELQRRNSSSGLPSVTT